MFLNILRPYAAYLKKIIFILDLHVLIFIVSIHLEPESNSNKLKNYFIICNKAIFIYLITIRLNPIKYSVLQIC